MELIFATTNKYKVASAQRVLDKYHIKVVGKGVEVAEIQADSVEEVITDKVKKCYEQLKEPMVAMDSGLFIESLKGFPGVYTRYVINSIGEDGLIRLTSHLDHPKAYVQRTIAYTDGKEIKLFKSKREGEIIQEKRGFNGANYDFIFYVPKMGKTLAEMTNDEQDSVWGDAWDQVGGWLSREIKFAPTELPEILRPPLATK